MTTRNIEILVGLFVALGLAALLMLAMKVSNLADIAGGNGYRVYAFFDNIGGLKVRSPVTMAGVQVGRVTDIGFDQRALQARVTLTIRPEFASIPADTSASIFTAGLLGEQYVSLLPGGDEEVLKEGAEIQLTQSAVVLEEIIGQFLYSQASEGSGGSGKGGF